MPQSTKATPKSQRKTDKHKVLKLYWVWTEDHDEDWFVVAPDLKAARTFFFWEEGYDDLSQVQAELVTTLPDELQGRDDVFEGWPAKDVLEKCGATIKDNGSTRAVQLGDRTYFEGLLQREIDSDLKRNGFDPYANH